MSNTAVWKFPVPQGGQPKVVGVTMPVRAEILHAGQQDDVPMVWAAVDPAVTEREVRRILVLPTGATVSERVFYIGTTTLHEGAIVAHVFEVMS